MFLYFSMDYSILVKIYEDLEGTSKRLEKTKIISEFIKKNHSREIIYLLQGKVLANVGAGELGINEQLVIKALEVSYGISKDKIIKVWKKKGDLGLTAEELGKIKFQKTLFSKTLTVTKVFDNLVKLSELSGSQTVNKKMQLIAELLTSAEPLEARYIVRTLLGDLRIGIKEGVIRDAIVWAFFPGVFKKGEIDRGEYNNTFKEVQRAYNVCNDFYEVIEFKDSLKSIKLNLFNPLKAMLFQKSKNIEEGFKVVGKPAAIDYKIDGFRVQVHKKNDSVKLFTRNFEDITRQFPDVIKIIKNNIKGDNLILDCEIVGIKDGKWLPFQNISQRIRRKYNIEEMVKEVPVMLIPFDAMMIDDNLLNETFKERRKKLKLIVKEEKNKIELVKQIVTDDIGEAEKFYNKALKNGNEGIMMKNLESPYQPGSRVGYGVKVKPTMKDLDLVIVKAEYGKGKRSKWYTSFTLACKDGEGNYLEVGKMGTGIKEKSEGVTFEELTEELKKNILEEKGREIIVKPEIIVQVTYEEIQKSPNYRSGYALRFPRLIAIRKDKPLSELNSLKEIEKYYKQQRNRG